MDAIKKMAKIMAQYLKSWESPRSQGRNIKGKGGSARARQLKKQRQSLRNKLNQQTKQREGSIGFLPIFFKEILFEYSG
jgi:hypothetical protein